MSDKTKEAEKIKQKKEYSTKQRATESDETKEAARKKDRKIKAKQRAAESDETK